MRVRESVRQAISIDISKELILPTLVTNYKRLVKYFIFFLHMYIYNFNFCTHIM